MKTLAENKITQVWKHFIQYRDIQSRNTLIEYYLPIVKYTAARLHVRFPRCVELEELYSIGVWGLMDAIDKYDPSRKVKFESYCAKRIHGTIVDDIRHNDWVPRLVRSRAKQLEKVTQKLLSLFGRSPTETEMAGELGMEMEEFYHFQRDANTLGLISLNAKVSDSDGECEGIDFITDHKSQNPFLEIQRQDIKDFITKGFSRQEQLIVVLYYFEQMTMKEIGETLGISESRVCQLHSSLIARLREQMKMTGLCMREQHVI